MPRSQTIMMNALYEDVVPALMDLIGVKQGEDEGSDHDNDDHDKDNSDDDDMPELTAIPTAPQTSETSMTADDFKDFLAAMPADIKDELSEMYRSSSIQQYRSPAVAPAAASAAGPVSAAAATNSSSPAAAPAAIHCCNSSICTATTETNPAMKRCKGCKGVWYCDRRCQKNDWRSHRHDLECNPLRAARDKAKAACYIAATDAEAVANGSGCFLKTAKRSGKQHICRRLKDGSGRVVSIERAVAVAGDRGNDLAMLGGLLNGGAGVAHMMSRSIPGAKATVRIVTEQQARHLLERAPHLLLTRAEQKMHKAEYWTCA